MNQLIMKINNFRILNIRQKIVVSYSKLSQILKEIFKKLTQLKKKLKNLRKRNLMILGAIKFNKKKKARIVKIFQK